MCRKTKKLVMCYLRPAFVLPIFVLGGAVLFGAYKLLFPPQPGGEILARWVQVVPRGDTCWLSASEEVPARSHPSCGFDFLVRAVVPPPPAACPTVTIEGEDGNGDELKLNERRNSYDSRYPIVVCEAIVPTPLLQVSAISFPNGGRVSIAASWRKGGPENLAIIGDTGCRDNEDQDCNDRDWPFAQLADDVAAGDPDMIIHLGDFSYGLGDYWAALSWQFFQPGRKLLAVAPWLLVRGNHERCGGEDAPKGWLYLFGYRPNGGVDTCANAGQTQRVGTYAIDFEKEGNKVRLVVADSSDPYAHKPETLLEEGGNQDDQDDRDIKNRKRYITMFEQAESLSRDTDNAWLVTHVPPFGIEKEFRTEKKKECRIEKKDGETSLSQPTEENGGETCVSKPTAMMLAAWTEAYGKDKPVPFKGVLSADRHLFQVVKPFDGKPIQIIVGSGGVNLDPLPDGKSKKRDSSDPKSVILDEDDLKLLSTAWGPEKAWKKVCSYRVFGYLSAKRTGADFDFDFDFRPLNEKSPGENDAKPCANLLKAMERN